MKLQKYGPLGLVISPPPGPHCQCVAPWLTFERGTLCYSLCAHLTDVINSCVLMGIGILAFRFRLLLMLLMPPIPRPTVTISQFSHSLRWCEGQMIRSQHAYISH